ncbi:MAG: winged helix-turn-helix domain-containing protein [archaeon]
MFEIEPDFMKQVFGNLRVKFRNSRKASDSIKIPASTFRSYKNGYVFSISEKTIKKIVDTKIISKQEIEKNTLSKFYRRDQIKKSMDNGRKVRIETLKEWKRDIPPFKEILNDKYLDLERWFLSYKKLIDFGARKFNYVKSKGDFLEVSYTTHSNKKKKEFIIKLPKKIKIDDDFLYFFGLWVGDKAGGKRFGIVNLEKNILSFSKKYLHRLHQDIEIFLYIGIKEIIPKIIKYDKIYWIKQKEKGVSFSVHAANGILASFFRYLESNLNEFLYKIKNFNIFFAGLFDAEGNIFLEDSCFRWSCKDPQMREIFKTHLKRLNLFNRDDGINLVTNNKEAFKNKILSYIIHSKKINNSSLIYYKRGDLEKRFKDILELIKNRPGITNNDLSKALKKKKVYAQVGVLERLGYVYSKNYPKQIYLNKLKL